MTTIAEDYCSFEVAKLLKEKGFDISNISPGIKNWICCMYDENGVIHWGIYDENWYFRITYQMARRWLREVHNIDIDIDAAVGMLGIKVYIPYISTYKPLEEDSSKVHQIKRGIYYKDDKGVIPALQHFESYEQAVEIALKYVLENLI